MNITVIGMIKNSADIIETFIRANGLYADQFVLIDNNSSDNTISIINKLIMEGFKIDIFYDNENAYLQSLKMNVLIQKVVAAYDTDWIIPLDDDEILIDKNGNDVREVISKWDTNHAYYSRWRIYIPTEEDDTNEICILRKEQFAFADHLPVLGKIIFSRTIAANENFRIVQGNHDFVGVDVKKHILDDLIIAHFPVRSQEQIISKALVGWTNYLAMPFRKENNGAHWEIIYKQIKKSFSVDISLMWQICLLYLGNVSLEEIEVKKMPLFLDEKVFLIKYTSRNEINPFLNYFENTENLAKAYEKLLTEKGQYK